MASLFSTAIVAICVGAQGSYNEACQKAIDAGTRQIGIRQKVDFAEDKTVHFAESKIKSQLSRRQLSVLSTGVFLYKTARDRRIAFRLPTFGLCDAITNEITLDSYVVNLRWNLR